MRVNKAGKPATVVRDDEGQWRQLSVPGVFLKVLRSEKYTGESTVLLRFGAGIGFPAHNHPGGEEVYVLDGDIKLGRHDLKTGDYLYTPPNRKHAAKSKHGCLILVRVPKPIEIVKGVSTFAKRLGAAHG